MPDGGFWVITVDRETGKASTEPLVENRDDAYQLSLDLETAETATAVVPRRIARRRHLS